MSQSWPVARWWPLVRASATSGLLAASAGLAAPASASAASSSASLTATVAVQQQIKSVTINPSSVTFGSCLTFGGGSASGSTLAFPNGSCISPQISVANNGTVPESVSIQGTSAVPSDNGTPWTLTSYNPSSGGPPAPGQDQYIVEANGQPTGSLATTPIADPTAGSALQPNAAVSEDLALFGPSASSDQSPQFATTVTWIAS